MVDFFSWELLGFALTCIFSTCSTFLFLYFLKKLFGVRKTTREILPFLGLAIVFLSFSIGFMMLGWIDYYWWESGLPINPLTSWQNFNGVIIIISFAAMGFLLEFVWRKTKFVLTGYTTIGILILMFLTANPGFILYIVIFFSPVILFSIPLWYVVFIRPTAGFLRRRMILALFGIILVFVGFLLRFQFMTDWMGLFIYSVGTAVSILGVCVLGFGFSGFSTFSDLKWQNKLREIFVIAESGVCLFAFSFDQNLPLEDTDLIAGGFSGIQGILSEMVKTSESLHLIDYQNMKIMLEQATRVMFVLIIKEESSFLEYKLKVFSEEFQKFYEEILDKWTGDIEVFKPTNAIIQRVFEV